MHIIAHARPCAHATPPRRLVAGYVGPAAGPSAALLSGAALGRRATVAGGCPVSQAVKQALLASADLPKNDRLVLIAIAAHANREGGAWPSVATIAQYVGVSERTVQRALARLVQAGRLLVRRVAGIATRVYRIVIDGATSLAQRVTSRHAGVPDQSAGGDTQSVSPEGEGVGRKEAPPHVNGRLNWRRYVPRRPGSTTPRQPQAYAERRGAALPPLPEGDRCQRPGHVGQRADRCIPCRSEAIARGAR